MPSHGSDDSVPAVHGDNSWAVALLLAASCGADPRLRVDEGVLDRLGIENKLLLFDAENELDIAVDDRDQVLDALASLTSERQAAEAERSVAERDVGVFRDKGDQSRARIAALRIEAAKARIDHIDAKRQVELVRLEQQERALVVARAGFELAKARLVKRTNVPGAEGLKLEDFEAQLERTQERMSELDERVAAAEAEAAQRELAWSRASAALRDQSGGAFGSRWLD